MSVQIGRLDAADKKLRNQQPRDRATILALMAGVNGAWASCNMRCGMSSRDDENKNDR